MRAWLLLGMVLLVRLSVAGMADEVPTDAAKVVPLVEAASGETHHELPVPARPAVVELFTSLTRLAT